MTDATCDARSWWGGNVLKCTRAAGHQVDDGERHQNGIAEWSEPSVEGGFSLDRAREIVDEMQRRIAAVAGPHVDMPRAEAVDVADPPAPTCGARTVDMGSPTSCHLEPEHKGRHVDGAIAWDGDHEPISLGYFQGERFATPDEVRAIVASLQSKLDELDPAAALAEAKRQMSRAWVDWQRLAKQSDDLTSDECIKAMDAAAEEAMGVWLTRVDAWRALSKARVTYYPEGDVFAGATGVFAHRTRRKTNLRQAGDTIDIVERLRIAAGNASAAPRAFIGEPTEYLCRLLMAAADELERLSAAALASPARAATSGAHEWIVVVHRDTETSAYMFKDEQPARAFFAPASEQWSESYLARVVIGPGPGFDAERAACDCAAFESSSAKGGGAMAPTATNCGACLDCIVSYGDAPAFRRMVLCPTCGNKRCPHALAHIYKCTGSNEVGQIAELSEARAANEAPAQERHGLASVHQAPVEVRGAKDGGA